MDGEEGNLCVFLECPTPMTHREPNHLGDTLDVLPLPTDTVINSLRFFPLRLQLLHHLEREKMRTKHIVISIQCRWETSLSLQLSSISAYSFNNALALSD